MRQWLSQPTQEQRSLLRQVERQADGGSRRPLFLDEITALGRMRLVHFDPDGALKLTDKGRAALAAP